MTTTIVPKSPPPRLPVIKAVAGQDIPLMSGGTIKVKGGRAVILRAWWSEQDGCIDMQVRMPDRTTTILTNQRPKCFTPVVVKPKNKNKSKHGVKRERRPDADDRKIKGNKSWAKGARRQTPAEV